MNVVGCTIVAAPERWAEERSHLLVGRGGQFSWMADPPLPPLRGGVVGRDLLPVAGGGGVGGGQLAFGVELTSPTLYNAPLEYVLETIAIGALGVIGAQTGVKAALPAPACVALGVTVCAGGLVRDVLCKRDVALGSQSFARHRRWRRRLRGLPQGGGDGAADPNLGARFARDGDDGRPKGVGVAAQATNGRVRWRRTQGAGNPRRIACEAILLKRHKVNRRQTRASSRQTATTSAAAARRG